MVGSVEHLATNVTDRRIVIYCSQMDGTVKRVRSAIGTLCANDKIEEKQER